MGAAETAPRPPRDTPVSLAMAVFKTPAEFERELIRERTVAGLEAARARGRKAGRKFALTKAQVRLANQRWRTATRRCLSWCRELGSRPVTLYRYVGPEGQSGRKVLGS